MLTLWAWESWNERRDIEIESSSELKPAHSLCIDSVDTDVHWGEGPCRLMKLIMRNHSSSMKSDDERADTHMGTLTVQNTDEQNNTLQCSVMQDINGTNYNFEI